VLLAPQIIELLYGRGYEEAVLPLRLLGLMTVMYGVNSLAATVLISRDRPKDFTRIVAVVAILNIVLNIVLIPHYGADAAAFNAALSGVLLAGLGVALVARRVGTVRVVRAFAAPTVGGSMITAVFLAAPVAPVFAFGLALAAYAAAVPVFERVAYPSDFRRLRAAVQGVVPRAVRPSDDG
jgi:O-antigen/teichoic acid export membrane protein